MKNKIDLGLEGDLVDDELFDIEIDFLRSMEPHEIEWWGHQIYYYIMDHDGPQEAQIGDGWMFVTASGKTIRQLSRAFHCIKMIFQEPKVVLS